MATYSYIQVNSSQCPKNVCITCVVNDQCFIELEKEEQKGVEDDTAARWLNDKRIER